MQIGAVEIGSVPRCEPTTGGEAVIFTLRDTDDRDFTFACPAEALQELSMKLVAAGEGAARNRGDVEGEVDDTRQVRALILKRWTVGLGEKVIVSLYLAASLPIDVALSPSDASKLSSELAVASQRFQTGGPSKLQ